MVLADMSRGFFEQNRELRFFTPFKELIQSVGEEKASHISWISYYLYHYESKFNRTEPDVHKRYKMIVSNIEDFNLVFEEFDEDYDSFSDKMIKAISTKEEKIFMMWDAKLDQLTDEIKKGAATKENLSLMLMIEKVAEAIQKARERMVQTKGKSQLHGQGQEGYHEKRARRKRK